MTRSLPDPVRALREPRLALLAAFLLATPLAAQSEDAATLSLDSLLSVPVTAAARYEQTASRAPSSVTIITGDEIRTLGLRTVGEILALVPGFYTTDDRNYLSVGVRGLGLPGDYNNRILLLLNGHPINDPEWGSAMLGSDLALDPATLERVEVVRGPGSALYGNNAMFAVVHLVTRGVASLEGFEVRARGGSHQRRGADVEWTARPARGLHIHAAATLEATDGEDIAIPGTSPAVTSRGQDADEVTGLAAEASWGAWSLRGRVVDRDKGIGTGAWDTSFEDSRTGTSDAHASLVLVWERDVAAGHALRVAASADRFSYRGAYVDLESGSLYLDGSDLRRVMLEGQWTWDPTPGTRFVTGGDYRNHYRQDYWGEDAGERAFDEDVPFESWSAFATAEQRLFAPVTLVLGVRHDRLSDGGRSTAPRAALVYDDGTTTLKALAGTAFRFPNFYERYYEDFGAVPGGDLDPERVRTIELVAARRLSGALHGGVSLFRSEIDDMVISSLVDDELTTFVNGGSIETEGVEASLEARLPGHASARAAYTWVRGRDVETGDDAPNVPAHVAQVHAYGPVTPFVVLGLEGRYESGRKTLWDTHTGEVVLVNAHVQVPELVAGLTPGLRVRNLFDRDYALPGGLELPTDRVSQPRRQWVLELRYRF
jgi:iron complex outermembrane receptor protein